MPIIQKKLRSLVSLYIEAGVRNPTGLLYPASKQEIDFAFKSMGGVPSESLTEIWKTYGGQPCFDTGTDGVFGSYRLLSPEESVDEYEFLEDTWYSAWDEPPGFPPSEGESGGWVPGLIPFAKWDQYDLLIDPATEVVWGFCYHGLNCRFESVDVLLDKLVEYYPYKEPRDPSFENWGLELTASASDLCPVKG